MVWYLRAVRWACSMRFCTLAQDRHGDLIDALEILELTVGLTLERGSLDEDGLRFHHALTHLRHDLQQLDKVFTVIEL